MLEAITPGQPKALHYLFPTASDEGLDMVYKLLQFNPKKRLTAEEALAHPYMSQ